MFGSRNKNNEQQVPNEELMTDLNEQDLEQVSGAHGGHHHHHHDHDHHHCQHSHHHQHHYCCHCNSYYHD